MVAEIFERVSAREDDIRELLNVKDDEPLKLESFVLAQNPLRWWTRRLPSRIYPGHGGLQIPQC